MSPATNISQPWIRRSAFGFIAIGLGALGLSLLHVDGVHNHLSPLTAAGGKAVAFLVTVIGYFMLLQKYLHRRRVLLDTRGEVNWRSDTLNTAPFGVLSQSQDKAPFLNAQAQGWLGVKSLGSLRDVATLLQPADEGRYLEAVTRLDTLGEGFTLDVTLRGNERPVHIVGAPAAEVGSRTLWLLDRRDQLEQSKGWARERAVFEAEVAKLTVVAQALPRPIWLRKLNGTIVWVNKSFADVMETTAEDCVAQGYEFSPRVGVASARALARRAVEAGSTQSEDRHVVVEGTRKLFRVYEIPVVVEGYVIGFAVDQTELEDVTSELNRHLSAFEETLEQVGAPIAIFGPDQRLQFYNQAYQRLWQFEDPFLKTHPSYSDMLEDLRERRKLPEVVDFGRYRRERLNLFTSLIETQEEMWHLPDGTTIRHLSIPHPLGGLMFVTEDVTDKLALESSYNTLIAVQQETLDNLAEGIAVIGSDGRLKLSNPSFAQIWELDGDALAVGPHVNEMMDQMRPLLSEGDDWATLRQAMVARMLDRTPREAEEIMRLDHSVLEHASVPLPDGNVLHSYLDVTARTRVEAALRATNRALAAADKLKSEFVANVSYQLRTPLSTIIGFAEILTNQYFGPLNDRQMDYAKTILEASRKLLSLINTVLDLATIEAGRMLLSRRPVEVKRLFAEATTAVAAWAERQQLNVVQDCPDDLQQPEIDERRVQQVLFNLLTNAVQYTPPGGTITLSAKQDNAMTVITITDTGIGMTEAERDRVFNKFERANPQARQPGVGLGLSLVKSLVELHGGKIELHSKVNEGTQVVFTLPNHPGAGAEAAA